MLCRCLTAVIVAAFVVAATAQDAAAPLQGRWVVTGAEHNGKPIAALNGGVMTITGTAFEIRTARGNVLNGTLRLDASKRPFQMDLVHADGTVWEAIYEVAGDMLRLNYVEKGGKDPRPAAFLTSPTTEETIVVLIRDPQP
jgi:uncharacterized protein (TIGR03067 family)